MEHDSDAGGGALPLQMTGPFDVEPVGELDRELGLASGVHRRAPDIRGEWLETVLMVNGVQLGPYDRTIVAWLSRWDPSTIHVVAAWTSQAAAGGVR